MLITKTFAVGVLATNCYVVNNKETLQAAVIDPGFDDQGEADEIMNFIRSNGLQIKFIVNTHGHPDHTCGNAVLKDKFHVPICIHKYDAYMLGESGRETTQYFGYSSFSPSPDILLSDGDIIKIGDLTLNIIHTPGHTFGSTSLLGETEVFTGDALFAGSIGRTDFPGSSDIQMQATLRKRALWTEDYDSKGEAN